jgi:hypothetical protein
MSNQISDGDNASYIQYWLNDTYQTNGSLILDVETIYQINTTTNTPPLQTTLYTSPFLQSTSAGWVEVRLTGLTPAGGIDQFAQLIFYRISSTGVLTFSTTATYITFQSNTGATAIDLVAVANGFIVRLTGGAAGGEIWQGYCKILNIHF